MYIMEDLFDSIQDKSFAPLIIQSSATLMYMSMVGIVRVFVDVISISSNFDLKVSFVPKVKLIKVLKVLKGGIYSLI